MINSPSEFLSELTLLFPEFDSVWDISEEFGYEGDDLSYHYILLVFSSSSHTLLSKASPRQLKNFCALINRAVEQGGKLENAITTCLLEHASQVGIFQAICPYLSDKAKSELR